MSETVKIGNSWYVVEDICGFVGPQGKEPPKMLMRGGHILSMTDLGEDVIEYIRQLRAGEIAPPQKPNSQAPGATVADFIASGGEVGPDFIGQTPAVTDVDMAEAKDIPA